MIGGTYPNPGPKSGISKISVGAQFVLSLPLFGSRHCSLATAIPSMSSVDYSKFEKLARETEAEEKRKEDEINQRKRAENMKRMQEDKERWSKQHPESVGDLVFLLAFIAPPVVLWPSQTCPESLVAAALIFISLSLSVALFDSFSLADDLHRLVFASVSLSLSFCLSVCLPVSSHVTCSSLPSCT